MRDWVGVNLSSIRRWTDKGTNHGGQKARKRTRYRRISDISESLEAACFFRFLSLAEDHFPIVLHADYRPAFLVRLIVKFLREGTQFYIR
jgi:hypothetical protein